jgi:anti-sigma factor RsiW
MSCRELVELITDYFEGALDGDTRAAFDRHVAVCPGCENYVEQMRSTLRLAHEGVELEEQPEVVGLLAAFRDWRA